MSDIVYKLIRPEVKVDSDGVITATLSTEAEDRDGDVIRATGWQLDHFLKHPVLLSSHDYGDARKQIGEWRNVRTERGKLVGEPHYYHDMGNDEADWAYRIARMGKAAYSVGFAPIEDNPRKGRSGREFTKQELLECSHVTIPSNRDALQLMAKTIHSGPVADVVHELLSDEPVRKDGPVQCCVSGCDDMSSAHVGVCADHMKMLAGLPPNPTTYGRSVERAYDPDPDADQTEYAIRILAGWSRRLAKAGRQLSGQNMTKLHTALGALHDLHDPNCKDGSCEFGGSDDGPDVDGDYDGDTDKALWDLYTRGMSEGSGSDGGVTVSDGGTHGKFTGSHSHSHDGQGVNEDGDGLHAHSHSHDGDGDHGHSHDGVNFKHEHSHEEKAPLSSGAEGDLPDSAFAVVLPGGTKKDGVTTPHSLRLLPHHTKDGGIDASHLRNALARVNQIDAPDDVKAAAERHLEAHAKDEGIGEAAEGGDKNLEFAAALRKAIEQALEGVEI